MIKMQETENIENLKMLSIPKEDIIRNIRIEQYAIEDLRYRLKSLDIYITSKFRKTLLNQDEENGEIKEIKLFNKAIAKDKRKKILVVRFLRFIAQKC